MQNRYVGDVGDFAKHGLLRFLSGMTDPDEGKQLKLGVVWYLHHDEKHPPADNVKISGDGDHIEYITRIPGDDKSNFRNCDPGTMGEAPRSGVQECPLRPLCGRGGNPDRRYRLLQRNASSSRLP